MTDDSDVVKKKVKGIEVVIEKDVIDDAEKLDIDAVAEVTEAVAAQAETIKEEREDKDDS